MKVRNFSVGEVLPAWKIRDELLIGVGQGASFGVDFLEDSHHLGGEKPDVIVVTEPESDGIKFLLEVSDFDDRLGFADIHHLSEEDEPGIERLARLLFDEREVNLVSEERIVGGNSDVILEDVQDQLIDDAQLNLVATDESNVPSCVAIEADYLSQ